MKNIHFIVNTIAGKGNHNLTTSFLKSYFNKIEYNILVKHTLYKKHAISLTQESIIENAHIIVACGGDGTINEVASCLVNTNIILGIIPIGSGNGLASNLNISKNINEALFTLKNQSVKRIDVGLLNNHYFFSNTGIGFDAQVIKNYEASHQRTIYGYINATLKSIRKSKKLKEVETRINNKTFTHKPFLIFISNSNELGYNFSLTPKASLEDGELDILIVSEISTLKIMLFMFLMLFKRHNLLNEVECYQSKQIKITQKNKPLFQIQLDGEFLLIKNSSLEVSILEKALRVIC